MAFACGDVHSKCGHGRTVKQANAKSKAMIRIRESCEGETDHSAAQGHRSPNARVREAHAKTIKYVEPAQQMKSNPELAGG